MTNLRILCLLGALISTSVKASDVSTDDGMVEQIAAHFEAASSRLRHEDTEALDLFVSRAKSIPGAHLALLVPMTSEPARSRFVAARVGELEHRVQALAEIAEYRRVADKSNADVIWLALVLPTSAFEKNGPTPVGLAEKETASVSAAAPLALTAPSVSATTPRINPADLRLAGWVVRGVKRPAQGPVSAYVARTALGAVPREVFEHQTDREFGLVKEISPSAEEGWVVHTEIGWVGQNNPPGNP